MKKKLKPMEGAADEDINVEGAADEYIKEMK
jgi:hypothetical protein